ncbi:MAG: hypothetical protein ACRC2T_08945 [Thermoguttaceae bacterium]
MEILFDNSRIEKICTNQKTTRKELGKVGCEVLDRRLKQMSLANNLELLRYAPGNFHELKGSRRNQIAVSLHGLVRLVFEPSQSPPPIKPDGGLDWSQITSVIVIDITDYH